MERQGWGCDSFGNVTEGSGIPMQATEACMGHPGHFLDEVCGSETLPPLPARCRRYEDLLYRGGDEVVVAAEFVEGGFGEEWERDGADALGEVECGE